jgi:hypothetical protein
VPLCSPSGWPGRLPGGAAGRPREVDPGTNWWIRGRRAQRAGRRIDRPAEAEGAPCIAAAAGRIVSPRLIRSSSGGGVVGAHHTADLPNFPPLAATGFHASRGNAIASSYTSGPAPESALTEMHPPKESLSWQEGTVTPHAVEWVPSVEDLPVCTPCSQLGLGAWEFIKPPSRLQWKYAIRRPSSPLRDMRGRASRMVGKMGKLDV